MIVLGVDFETTGLDPKEALIIELGACLWDTKKRKPVSVYSTRVWSNEHPEELKPKIIEVTGLTTADVQTHGISPKEALAQLNWMAEQATMILAHSGEGYDRPLYEANAARYDLSRSSLPWIDTRYDVPYDPWPKNRKLGTLAELHGIQNTWAHCAVSDVLTMLTMVSKYDFGTILELSRAPLMLVAAEVSYAKRQDAKDRGFWWNQGLNKWVTYIRATGVAVAQKQLPFKLTVVQEVKRG